MSLSQEAREKIMEDCYADPILYLKTFLHDHFYLEIPWVHRGITSILTKKARFLLGYGQLRKIVENFVHTKDEKEIQIFHVLKKGTSEELTKEELDALDEHIADDLRSGGNRHEHVDCLICAEVEIRLDLGTYTLIMMPRGSSKTTLAGFGIPLYNICYQIEPFTLYVSKAGPHSQGQLESCRKEIAQNEMILEVFGDLKPKRSDEERWSKEKFETSSGLAMQYRGKGAAIRGINHNNFRPSLIIVDDPQSKDDVKSETIRADDKIWAFAELTPARARIVGSRGSIVALGTWLHPQCLVALWAEDPRWTTVKIAVKDRDGEFIWPAYMDEAEYEAERASFQRAGLTAAFHREYHNEEVEEGELPFQQRFFIYDPVVPTEDIVFATYADLASSEKREADFSSIVTVGLNTKGLIWVAEAWIERVGAREEEKIDEYFRQSLTWGSLLHGFESNAYQAVFGTLLRAEMFKRSHYFEVEAVTHKTRKVDRIRGALRPRYASGFVRHRVPFPRLEQQLLDFRLDDSHEHDDGPDAEAACLVLLDPAAAFHAEVDPAEEHLEDDEEMDDAWNWAS
jgi:hypothetical protein